jgi:AcrR family transcriptional regulator
MTMADPTPRRADRKRQTRELLIETALDLMAERGITATRTRQPWPAEHH